MFDAFGRSFPGHSLPQCRIVRGAEVGGDLPPFAHVEALFCFWKDYVFDRGVKVLGFGERNGDKSEVVLQWTVMAIVVLHHWMDADALFCQRLSQCQYGAHVIATPLPIETLRQRQYLQLAACFKQMR